MKFQLKQHLYLVTGEFPENINSIIPVDYHLKTRTSETNFISYYDTFDWLLYQNGYLLQKKNATWTLQDKLNNAITAKTVLRKNAANWHDFPESKVKDVLASVTKMRSILPLIEFSKTTTRINVLNSFEKTVVRLFYSHHQFANKNSKAFDLLTIEEMRGFTDEFNEICNAIQEAAQLCETSFFQIVANFSNTKPAGYSGKVTINLHPQETTAFSLQKILLEQLETVRANEKGVNEDIDIEFLHDFRVAIRRTRSALSLIKNVFPENDRLNFKKRFANVQRQTNELRDLDVFLYDQQKYLSLLPDTLKTDMKLFLKMLQVRRKKALVDVKKLISSQEYKALLNEWQVFLETFVANTAEKNAETSVIKYAKKRIYKRYQRILVDGEAVLSDSPDEMVHEVRIDCKKLRYLLEFFSSLFNNTEIKMLIKQLKKLQNVLGNFNDYAVQNETMINYIENFDNSKTSGRVFAAVGFLAGNLQKRKEIERNKFESAFKEFSSRKTKQLFDSLFL